MIFESLLLSWKYFLFCRWLLFINFFFFFCQGHMGLLHTKQWYQRNLHGYLDISLPPPFSGFLFFHIFSASGYPLSDQDKVPKEDKNILEIMDSSHCHAAGLLKDYAVHRIWEVTWKRGQRGEHLFSNICSAVTKKRLIQPLLQGKKQTIGGDWGDRSQAKRKAFPHQWGCPLKGSPAWNLRVLLHWGHLRRGWMPPWCWFRREFLNEVESI